MIGGPRLGREITPPHTMTLRLPVDMYEELKLVAQVRHSTVNDEIEAAVHKHLNQHRRRAQGRAQ